MTITPGYRLNPGTVRQDLHRLLSTFLAIEPVTRYARDDDDPLIVLQALCAEDDVIHLLVSTAVSNRLQLEHMNGLRNSLDEYSWTPLEGVCGILEHFPINMHHILRV
jgi:hypothetical protein